MVRLPYLIQTSLLSLCLALGLPRALARSEYAAENLYVSCNVCHVNPLGGGLRNETGKIFGSRDLGLSDFSRNQWFQVDFRAPFQRATNSRGEETKGVAVMNVIAAAQIPILKDSEGQETSSFIAANSFGILDNGLHESYALIRLSGSQLMIGRFAVPFGLATDEHRTYTRLQTRTTVKDFESGMAVSGDLGSNFHYDFSATSGLDNDASGNAIAATDSPYGLTGNIRWNPLKQPMFFGLSHMIHGTTIVPSPIEATSVFLVAATNHLTNNHFKGSLLLELVSSKGFNNSLLNSNVAYFFPAGDPWGASVAASQAQGLNFGINWSVSSRLVAQFKYEQFTPDVNYSADTFTRNGYGFKYFFNSNMDLILRYEKSLSTRPGLTELGTVSAVRDYVNAIFHLWI